MVTSSELDSTFGALADPIRRSVLRRLANGEASVSALAVGFRISPPAFLKHIRVLEGAGLVRTRKIGRVRNCRRLTSWA
jgi:DNA-binding transcriptional ArsR family regulator